MPKSKKTSDLGKEVLFEYYAPGAKAVSVAGSFNEWDVDKELLKKEKGGWWRLKVKLPIGRYEYRYLVDGNWENDQRPVVCVPNHFGSWNCVVEVA